MKTITSLLLCAFVSIGIIQAQENKDVQQTTTVKKVTMRNDAQITTQVIEETDAELEVIEVEDNEEEDQRAIVVKKDLDKVAKVADSNADNTPNKLIVKEKKEQLKVDLQRSKEMELERAAKEKMILEQNKAKMQAELEARRKALESRPKGMAKLKKDNE